MLQSLFRPSSFSSPLASSSRHVLPSFSVGQQVRFRSNIAPKRTKFRKNMKGMPIRPPTGGSLRGSTLNQGSFGVRILESSRITGAQLTACRDTMKRKLKPVKGCEVIMRVFPHLPVSVKGNEVRMGKGKGANGYWAARVPAGRVLFELQGGDVQEAIARQAISLCQDKLPVKSEFIKHDTPARLGLLVDSSLTKPPSNQPVPALMEWQKINEQGSLNRGVGKWRSMLDRLAERRSKRLAIMGVGGTVELENKSVEAAQASP
ncbi:ribosomal protein L16p/L10e-domain-containing protein [Naematelia encephala]|uniref:Ribosomal protein L16p/L10e-domain-containing protein n=1 Tax=Naematelia encephala TaxID=71784 RepID=A0A1Y2AV83_9TREE|nr:ribosomal protein L16p/L10e-domain-containing protein [Naematelia encephala]